MYTRARKNNENEIEPFQSDPIVIFLTKFIQLSWLGKINDFFQKEKKKKYQLPKVVIQSWNKIF